MVRGLVPLGECQTPEGGEDAPVLEHQEAEAWGEPLGPPAKLARGQTEAGKHVGTGGR